MIKLQNISLSIGDNLNIFDNVSLDIPKEKITVLVGLNGVGKTTLLKIIAGIIKPQTGIIQKESKELFYLPQRIKYPKGISLYDYVESSFYKKNWKWFLNAQEKQKIEETLEMLELTKKKNTLIENLSSGEIQKANIALGLLSSADTLLLDEPTSNMDLINQIKVLDILKKLTKKRITPIVVLHDINLGASYGDYFIGFTKSNKVIMKNKNEFFTSEILNKIFGINFKVINSDKDFHVQVFN